MNEKFMITQLNQSILFCRLMKIELTGWTLSRLEKKIVVDKFPNQHFNLLVCKFELAEVLKYATINRK